MSLHDNPDDRCRAVAAQLNAEAGSLLLEPPAWPVLPGDEGGGGDRDPLADGGGDHAHLFAREPCFVSRRQVARMAELVEAVESVVALPAWQAHALSDADPVALDDHGPRGVFLGYDFHLGEGAPRLIEINTNAGGALLNATMAKARRASVAPADGVNQQRRTIDPLERRLVAMFREEWRRQRGDVPLQSIAIVDDAPQAQYLAPEFQLFERLFRASGLDAMVADPSELQLRGDRLCCRGRPVDLVYNRLTDFTLADPAHGALRAAYVAGHVVLTPHPRAHALYADKRLLALLSDDALLRSWGVGAATRAVLAATVPRTVRVTDANRDALWASRRRLFFKPARGHGSKGAYRGDKLTLRAWQQVVAGDYVAQEFAPAGTRHVRVGGRSEELKVDVRNYVYDGRVQLLAARMFQGQTTNFRTAGGGFAPVVEVDDAVLAALAAGRRPSLAARPVETPGVHAVEPASSAA